MIGGGGGGSLLYLTLLTALESAKKLEQGKYTDKYFISKEKKTTFHENVNVSERNDSPPTRTNACHLCFNRTKSSHVPACPMERKKTFTTFTDLSLPP